MTPEEIASWIESACPHTCDFRGECWQCLIEVITAATKALREENEKLLAHVEHLEKLEPWWGGVLKRSVQRAGALQRADAANQALVEALDVLVQSSAWESLEATIPAMTPEERRAVAIILETLNANEEAAEPWSQATGAETCFRPGKCKQPRNHEGPCDDWIAEGKQESLEPGWHAWSQGECSDPACGCKSPELVALRKRSRAKESLPKASEEA